jgi:hypothetical protein
VSVGIFPLLSGQVASLTRQSRNTLRARFLYSRPFSRKTRSRVLLLTIGERIPQSQVHPFHFYSQQILDQYDAEIREVSIEQFLMRDNQGLRDATTVCFQTGFDVADKDLDLLLEVIHERNPTAQIVYLDWFAPTDLRLAERVNDRVSLYVKKHLLSDLSGYGLPTQGDTNLTDFYSRRFGLELPEALFSIPDGFLEKLVIGPSFATADFLINSFASDVPDWLSDRPIDIHARLATSGTTWYQSMRTECVAAVHALDGLHTLTETGVGLVQYLKELQASKICFSPFGYGEVCWRDYEAVANGAVLLKLDMSHIKTDPDIFLAGETYMPIAWDLSDFEEKIKLLLGDPGLCQRLTRNAFEVLHKYVASGRFVSQMERLFVPVQ